VTIVLPKMKIPSKEFIEMGNVYSSYSNALCTAIMGISITSFMLKEEDL